MTSTSVAIRTATYIKERARYRIARDLMQKRFDLNEKIGERFSDHYINTVKTLFFDNNVKPVTLVVDNRTFIRDFLQYYLSDEKINDERGVIHDDIKLEFVSSGIIPIRDEIKALFKLEKRENDLVFSETDSLSLQEMYRDSVLMKESGMILMEYRDMMQRLTMARLFLLQPLDILCREFLKDEQIIDVFLFGSILEYQKSNPVVFDDYIIGKIVERFHSAYLKEKVLNKNQEFSSITKLVSEEVKPVVALDLADTPFRYPQNIKNSDHLKSAKDADKIIADILAPHKGKVVYIDFWGTWCGPCIAEMETVPAAKKALEGKDVVFVYFANRTDKTAWVNFIKQMNIEGENVIHYNLPQEQQSMVERRLAVRSFPTYMLVDKEGNFMNMQAPRPSHKDRLVREIDKLLAK